MDFTPTQDVFKTFVEGLKMGQEAKERKAKEAALAANADIDKRKQDLAEATFGVNLGRASGGIYNSLGEYKKGLEAVSTAEVNAPKRTLAEIIGAGNPMPLKTPGGYDAENPTSELPIVTKRTDVVPRQASPQPYSQPGVSEEQIQSIMPTLSGANEPQLKQYQEGLNNLNTSYSEPIVDAEGNTQYQYSTGFGKNALKVVPKPKAGGDLFGWGYGKTPDPAEIDRIITGIHDGTINGNIGLRQKLIIDAAWTKKYPGESLAEIQAQNKAQSATAIVRAVNTIKSIIDGDPKTGAPPLIDTMEKVHTELRMSPEGAYGPLTRSVNAATAWFAEASGNPAITTFNALKAGLGAEISSALSAGGVPTDMRMEVELNNIQPDIPDAAFKRVMDVTRDILTARKSFFENTLPAAQYEAKMQTLAEKLKITIEQAKALPIKGQKKGTSEVPQKQGSMPSNVTPGRSAW